jgi:hypothetical protein
VASCKEAAGLHAYPTYSFEGAALVSNIVDFLELVGRSAQLRHVGQAELDEALRRAGFAPPVRAAMLESDSRALEVLAGAQANVCCMIVTPHEEEEEEEESESPVPSQVPVGLGITSHSHPVRRVA